LSLTGAEETFPFNDEVSVFKVGGKMFALSVLDAAPLTVSVKCDPEEAIALRAAFEAVAPGYHLNKRHWNTITCNVDVPDDEVLAMVDDSYALVVPRRLR
jgi:predicted DNA-binding protein (MmcQ/YjbR family)